MLKIEGKRAKIGMKVYDSWWPWHMGRIAKVLKSRVKVVMSSTSEVETFDKGHLQFLRIDR